MAAVLKVDLNAINAMPTQVDSLGQAFKYDLPTVDDPTRSTETNEPWGGNDGLNEARLLAGGPVQLFSPGFRNVYDLAVTATGIYTWDNGANPTWGGVPINEGTPNVTNQPNDTSGQTNNAAGLYRIFDGFYGGHPNPIRANPTGAGLYDESGNPRTLPSDWPPVPVSMADPRQGDYRLPGPDSGALITFPGSFNGPTDTRRRR